MSILKKGMRGEPVRRLQDQLGIDADGIFGGGTEAALKKYQEEQDISADGIAGPDTFAHLGLFELVQLKRGSRGEMVRQLQEFLGLDADGIFGGGTEQAVKDFQRHNDLAVDGIAGPDTLALMDVFDDFTPEVAEAAVVEVEPAGQAAPQETAEDRLEKLKKSIWDSVDVF